MAIRKKKTTVKKKTVKKKTKSVKKTKKKTTRGKIRKGAKYECRVCGIAVSIDEVCGCADVCDIICCNEQMKPKKK
jgi:hypothetical protein